MFWDYFNSSSILKRSKIGNITKFNTKIDKVHKFCHITYKIFCKEINLTLEDFVSFQHLHQQRIKLKVFMRLRTTKGARQDNGQGMNYMVI